MAKMKRSLLTLLLALSSSLFTFCEGQYSVLFNFNGTNGEWPEGSLTLSGGKLFGMTYYGGPSSIGNIFSVDTNGNNYKDLYDFNGTDGAYPEGEVTISGSKLYGMTSMGGASSIGNIFSMDTNGNGIKDLYDFSSGNSFPEGVGSLILSGCLLYGMTEACGTNNDGNIFCIDTNGNGYRDLFDFNNIDGGAPQGSLTLSGDKLYGMTLNGGTHTCGVVFSVDTNGSNYKVLLNFDSANGAYPDGDLTIHGGTLYGMADGGGLYNSGCIFSIDTNGSNYKDLFDFNGPDGRFPKSSSLTLVGSMLYSTTSQGGLNGVGVISSIDTSGSNFSELFNDFDNINGESPSGVINDGNILYGMAKLGGANSEGVIFKFKEVGLGVSNVPIKNDVINIYPNPSNGIFTIVIASEAKQSRNKVEVYNMLGEKVYSSILPQIPVGALNRIDLSNQPNGIYLYRVIANTGELMGEGKMIIQK
jgi:uncharacterized repeat protein (TIGR03803 family)